MYKIIKGSGLRFLELIVWDKKHGMPITSKDMLTRTYEDILLMADDEVVREELDWIGVWGTENKAYFNKKTMKNITNYWRIGTNKTQINELLACFPLELPLRAIELVTARGEIVIDCFVGSGTTLIAADLLGRRCRAAEIFPGYVAVTIERWNEMTGQEPILLDNLDTLKKEDG